jgi:hypothetical protein
MDRSLPGVLVEVVASVVGVVLEEDLAPAWVGVEDMEEDSAGGDVAPPGELGMAQHMVLILWTQRKRWICLGLKLTLSTMPWMRSTGALRNWSGNLQNNHVVKELECLLSHGIRSSERGWVQSPPLWNREG